MNRTSPALLLVLALAFIGCEADDPNHRLVGQLESDRVEITADYAEPIIERAVIEGERAEAGQLLIRQDTARIDAQLAEAEAALRQTGARLDELVRGPRREQIVAAQASVEGARNELEFRETDLKRMQDLYDRELASSELRDRAQVARDTAAANLESLEARLDELLSGTTAEELRQAEASVKQSQARIDTLTVERERHSHRAPVAGVVDSLLFEPGERPQAGQPIAILLAGEQVYARVYVPEALRVQVRPGTRAVVYVDGMQGPVDGRVRWVSSEAAFTPYFALTEADRGRLSFAAKVDLLNVGRRLPDGVPVEVQLRLDDARP
jgi:HlyD family secretion protein